MLVQESLRRTEYMINSVSAGGEHRITEVWKSVKRDVAGAPVYDYTELVSPGEGHPTPPSRGTSAAFSTRCK